LETYIQEFNTLEGLAAQVAVLDGKAKLRYFVQGLQLNLRIGVAAATVQTTEEAQRIARAMNVVLAGKEQSAPRSDPMDTSERRRVERCWWCGIPGHVEANCKNKANGKPRKAQIGQESRQGKLVCYKCGKPGHIRKDCKVKFVKEGMAVDNKEDSEYLPAQGDGNKDGQSEKAEALPVLSNHRVLEDVGVCIPASLSPKPEPVEKAAFILENGTETKLVDVLSAGARAITVKGTFRGKKVNILVDTGCDIVCISSRIAPRSEWKKMHDLQVRGFNGGLVRCPAKIDVEWEMGQIRTGWKDAWVLPCMSYDIIIGTDWLSANAPRIDFDKCTITIGNLACEMDNVREDLIRNCATIQAYQLEQLLQDEKVEEIIAWNIELKKGATDEEIDEEIQRILQEFPDVFDTKAKMPLDRESNNFKIHLVAGARPQVRRHGRLSEREVEEMRKRIKELLEIGHIAPSDSPWSAPILFVRKKNGTLRMCIDYRALNELTIRDEFPLPRIDAIFDKLRKAKYFSALDLNMAYHQVRLEEELQACTAFTCEKGHYEFKVMTFGFTNAPPAFQRMMTQYLRDFLGKFVEVYLDDILIYSRTWEEHLQHIRAVLQRLREEKLVVKASKCKWGKEEVEYLGHIIGNGRIAADKRKTLAIREWKRPETTKKLQRFLGLVNYYREFIRDLAKIGRPLYEIKDKEELEWTEERKQAFGKIQEAVEELSYRVLWDLEKNQRVRTDASEDGMGLVLEQEEEQGWWPLAFYSRTWRPNKRNWPTHYQEMAALVEVLKK
jgi:hypothetical protein